MAVLLQPPLNVWEDICSKEQNAKGSCHERILSDGVQIGKANFSLPSKMWIVARSGGLLLFASK